MLLLLTMKNDDNDDGKVEDDFLKYPNGRKDQAYSISYPNA